jgi:TolA-binding protein
LIQPGEFFGVKSAMGKYPREETALVLSDSNMVVFSVPEFEQVVSANTRIIMKMLKVFSNQLRRIHKQVRNLMASGDQTDSEMGLYKIADYYLRHKKYHEAAQAYRRYLTYYPDGNRSAEAAEQMQIAEGSAGRAPRPAAAPAPAAAGSGAQGGAALTGSAKEFYNALSLFSQAKYPEALKQFKHILDQGGDDEYAAKSEYEIGRCLFSLKDYDRCIAHYTSMIQRYPKHPDLVEALFYVGSSYEKKNVIPKAKGFYSKILSMAPEESAVHRKARKALKAVAE